MYNGFRDLARGELEGVSRKDPGLIGAAGTEKGWGVRHNPPPGLALRPGEPLPVCPHCGLNHRVWWQDEDGDLKCPLCAHVVRVKR